MLNQDINSPPKGLYQKMKFLKKFIIINTHGSDQLTPRLAAPA
jgi:hypothetical protein